MKQLLSFGLLCSRFTVCKGTDILALFFFPYSVVYTLNTHYMNPFWCRSFSFSFCFSCSFAVLVAVFFSSYLYGYYYCWLSFILLISTSMCFFLICRFLCCGFGAWHVSSAVIKKIFCITFYGLEKKYDVLTVCSAFNVGTYLSSHTNGTIEYLLDISSLHVEYQVSSSSMPNSIWIVCM